MATNVLVITQDQTASNDYVDFTQNLYLYFKDDASFCCDHMNLFQPHLPNGESHTAGFLWGPAQPAGGSANKVIHWRTGAYGRECDDNAAVVNEVFLADKSPLLAAKGHVVTPLVAHVIHIGPGPAVQPLARILVRNPELAQAVREDWKATQHLLELIVGNSANLDPSIMPVLELLLHDGEEAYRTITREEEHG